MSPRPEEFARRVAREELREAFDDVEQERRGGHGGGSKSSEGRSKSSGRAVGFVPYHSLLSVVPDETAHDAEQFDALA